MSDKCDMPTILHKLALFDKRSRFKGVYLLGMKLSLPDATPSTFNRMQASANSSVTFSVDMHLLNLGLPNHCAARRPFLLSMSLELDILDVASPPRIHPHL
eukprot:8303334-Heterocapsa_arctica.AAC.1